MLSIPRVGAPQCTPALLGLSAEDVDLLQASASIAGGLVQAFAASVDLWLCFSLVVEMLLKAKVVLRRGPPVCCGLSCDLDRSALLQAFDELNLSPVHDVFGRVALAAFEAIIEWLVAVFQQAP